MLVCFSDKKTAKMVLVIKIALFKTVKRVNIYAFRKSKKHFELSDFIKAKIISNYPNL